MYQNGFLWDLLFKKKLTNRNSKKIYKIKKRKNFQCENIIKKKHEYGKE